MKYWRCLLVNTATKEMLLTELRCFQMLKSFSSIRNGIPIWACSLFFDNFIPAECNPNMGANPLKEDYDWWSLKLTVNWQYLQKTLVWLISALSNQSVRRPWWYDSTRFKERVANVISETTDSICSWIMRWSVVNRISVKHTKPWKDERKVITGFQKQQQVK